MGDEIIAFSNDTIFMEYGLEGVAGHQFSNKNLIIGKNGENPILKSGRELL